MTGSAAGAGGAAPVRASATALGSGRTGVIGAGDGSEAVVMGGAAAGGDAVGGAEAGTGMGAEAEVDAGAGAGARVGSAVDAAIGAGAGSDIGSGGGMNLADIGAGLAAISARWRAGLPAADEGAGGSSSGITSEACGPPEVDAVSDGASAMGSIASRSTGAAAAD